jgi:hypothetical protein
MHGFRHVPTNSVSLVFLMVFWHFEEIKKLFTTFKIRHRSPLFQQMENCDELHKLSFAFYKVPIRNLLSHKSLPMKNNIFSFIFNMLAKRAHVILTNIHP